MTFKKLLPNYAQQRQLQASVMRKCLQVPLSARRTNGLTRYQVSGMSTNAAEIPRAATSMLCYATSKTSSGIKAAELTELPLPIISRPNDVLVKVQATSVNALDVLMMRGYGEKLLSILNTVYNLQPSTFIETPVKEKSPLIVGRDFCGVVVGRGGGVQDLQLGQRVMGVVEPYEAGCHAQFVVTSRDNVVEAPECVPTLECASVPYAALSGYGAAGAHCSTRAFTGQRVLVPGASGGVGILLVQMLQAWGAQVGGVCSANSFDLLTSVGVTELYDYKDSEALQQLFSEKSFDLVVDASGSRSTPYIEALKRHVGASYVTLTFPLLSNVDEDGVVCGVGKSGFDLLQMNRASARDGRVVKWGFYRSSPAALSQLARLMEERKLVPVLDKVFKWSEIKEAYKHMELGQHCGKTVIDLSEL
ncbi:Alcohol dehydrogenase N-terminal [Trinorchestia longiramus]|nr:Alcohol dehydrogenase N-terminal [Trinorchestia longiramus]